MSLLTDHISGGEDFPCGCVAIWLEITVCVSMYVLRMCVFRWYTCAGCVCVCVCVCVDQLCCVCGLGVD